MLEKHFTKLVAEMISTSTAFPQLVDMMSVHRLFAELNICSVGEKLNEAEILSRLANKFQIGAPGTDGSSSDMKSDEEKLSVIKTLFRQIIDNKIDKQLSDIDNRKMLFMS
jgi:hypothetical protein